MNQIEMDRIRSLFDRMDHWRHFPNYQLERRADLFFSLYLPEILSAHLPFQVDDTLVPEFPIRKGAIYAGTEDDHQSVKADYLALAADRKTAVFIELKTDMGSRNETQDDYLKLARGIPFRELLTGIREIFWKTQAKRKYFALLGDLRTLGLLQIPPEWDELMQRGNLKGLSAMASAHPIGISAQVEQTMVVYVQPAHDATSSPQNAHTRYITFEDAATVIERHGDPLSLRFAQSLREWALRTAGEARLSCSQDKE